MDQDIADRIDRWEVLPGLPGEGPVPQHFHLGHPTPWSEGFVVRFWNADGKEWTGNFQRGSSFGYSEVVLWPEAKAAVVVAGDYFYLINGEHPDCYSTLGDQYAANGLMCDERRHTLFVAAEYHVFAYDSQRRLIWKKAPGGYVTRFLSCVNGVLTVEIEPEMGEPLETVEISTTVQSVDDRRYLDVLFGALQNHPEIDRIDPGLSNAEIVAVERRFGFMFPPDLLGLLEYAVPIGRRFPNWRDVSSEDLKGRFDGPVDGILFDVEANGFWLSAWGRRPEDSAAKNAVVREAVAHAPRLIPLYIHRYIPAVPYRAGNPVFSVHQTDIIHYGNDLADYFHREFGAPVPPWTRQEPHQIEFWTDALTWRTDTV